MNECKANCPPFNPICPQSSKEPLHKY
jgi:hypothetical protein